MWDILPADSDHYEYARWYENGRIDYKLIRVGVVSEREKRYSKLLQNLTTEENSMVLETNYRYPYRAKQELYYRGRWWTIKNATERGLDLAPQAMGLVEPEYNKQYYLEIMGVE